MRIVAISDTHNKFINLPEGDILVHAGDMTARGSNFELCEFAVWFEKQKAKFKYRIFIAGNHDFGLQVHKQAMLTFFDRGAIYLEHQAVEVEGIKFFGSPYTPIFFNWAFMEEDNKLKSYWDKISEDTQVLVTHGPPFSVLDKTARGDQAGSHTLLERVKKLPKLKAHIFGHIHEQGGKKETINNIDFYNVSVLDEHYKEAQAATVIEV